MATEDSGNHAGLVAEWPQVKGWKLAVKVNSTEHDSYTDVVVLVPQVPLDSGLALGYGQNIGTINDKRLIKIVLIYLKAYWDQTLLGKKESLLLMHEAAAFPEVAFEDI